MAAWAILLFTTLDALVKSVPASVPTSQVVVLRYGFALPVAASFAWKMRGRLLRLATWQANGLRGVLVFTTASCFFFALRVVPFAEVLALSFLAPLFMALLAAVMLGERLRLRILLALVIGFAGVLTIIAGGLRGAPVALAGMAAALGAAVAYALGNILLRRQAQKEPAEVIVLIQHIVPCILALPLAAIEWVPLAPVIWIKLALLATIGVLGHLCLTWAYARAQAGVLGVMEYTALPWAAGIGYLIFGEVPLPQVWIGAGLIVAACLMAARSRAVSD